MPREIKPGLDFANPNRIENLGIDWMGHGVNNEELLYVNQYEETKHKENSAKIGEGWDYHIDKDPIKYYFNDIGFREIDTDKQNPNRSVAVFGCSHVMGAGNFNHNTISAFLEHYTGYKCLNYGAEGGTITTVYNNILKFLDEYDTCKGIAIVWPSFHRHTTVWRYAGDNVDERWRRHDLRPGEDKISFHYEGTFFTRKLNEVHPVLDKSFCVDNPHNIYLINQYRTAIRLICKARNIPVAEISVSDLLYHRTHSIWDKLSIKIPGEFKAQFDRWWEIDNYAELSEKAQWYYLNKFCARDLINYVPYEPLRWTSHWGSEVNRGFAKTLFDRFSVE